MYVNDNTITLNSKCFLCDRMASVDEIYQHRTEICEQFHKDINFNDAKIPDLDKVTLLLESARDKGFLEDLCCKPLDGGDSVEYDMYVNRDNAPNSMESLLEWAVRLNRTQLLALMVEKDIAVHWQDEKTKIRIVHNVATKGTPQVMEFLKKYGADLECRDGRGYTPLLTAAESYNHAVVHYLLKEGCDVHQQVGDYFPMLFYLARNHTQNCERDAEYYSTLKTLIKKTSLTKMNLLKVSPFIETQYHEVNERVEIVSLLFDSGLDINMEDKVHKCVPLAALCMGPHCGDDIVVTFKLLTLYLDHGANINMMTDRERAFVIHWVARFGTPHIMQVLKNQGADLECKKYLRNSPTPISAAADAQNHSVVQYLLGVGCDVYADVNEGFGDCKIPMMVYLRYGPPNNKHDEFYMTLKALIKETKLTKLTGASLHEANLLLMALIHTIGEQLEIISLLIDSGLDMYMRQWQHISPLIYLSGFASRRNNVVIHKDIHIQLVKLLLDKGTHVNAVDRNRMSCVSLNVICNSYTDNRTEEILKLLLESGADPNTLDKPGYSPLQYICGMPTHLYEIKDYNSTDITICASLATLLYQHGACVSILDKPQLCKLVHCIACVGTPMMMEELMTNDIDLECRGSEYMVSRLQQHTPLVTAAEAFNHSMVKYLLKVKCNVYQTNVYSDTPLMLYLKHTSSCNRDDEFYSTLKALIENTRLVNSNHAQIFFLALDHKVGEVVKIVSLLIDSGLDIHQPEYNGNSLLMYLCGTERITKVFHAQLIELTLNKGADRNTRSRDNAEMSCVAKVVLYIPDDRAVEVLKELLKHGADTNTIDNNGYAPLHYVCGKAINTSEKMFGLTQYIRTKSSLDSHLAMLLLKHGAIPDILDERESGTPMHQAALNSKMKCIEILCQHGGDTNIQNAKGYKPAELYPGPQHAINKVLGMLNKPEEQLRVTLSIVDDIHANLVSSDYSHEAKIKALKKIVVLRQNIQNLPIKEPEPEDDVEPIKFLRLSERLSREFTGHWKTIFRELMCFSSSAESTIIDIENQFQPLSEQMYQALLKWKKSTGKEATLERLRETLELCKEQQAANILAKWMKK